MSADGTFEFRFPKITTLLLIGGGDTMLDVARRAKATGLDVRAILAPRHADEVLPIAGTVTAATLTGIGCPFEVVEDINAWSSLTDQNWAPATTAAFCFGPAWIFSPEVRARFGAGMVNCNPIPVPRYLGGAHYTWQILNGDREGGCVFQLITDRLDRGPILRSRYFDIPEGARTPYDYFLAYNDASNDLMASALEDVVAGNAFQAVDFESVQTRRLYLPRLFTVHNAYIDWRWNGSELERFCCAFDRPYMGAGTYVDGTEIRLSDVAFEPGEAFHPFLSGLVVRRLDGQVWVSVTDGLLHIGEARMRDGQSALDLLKEGRRLATPPDKVFEAMIYRPNLSGKGIS